MSSDLRLLLSRRNILGDGAASSAAPPLEAAGEEPPRLLTEKLIFLIVDGFGRRTTRVAAY